MKVVAVDLLENLTAKCAPEQEEVPVVAIAGLPAIKGSVVESNLNKGLLQTLGMASVETRSAELDYDAKP